MGMDIRFVFNKLKRSAVSLSVMTSVLRNSEVYWSKKNRKGKWREGGKNKENTQQRERGIYLVRTRK